MAKCPICGGSMGFGTKMKVRDGVICPFCTRITPAYSTLSIAEIKDLLEKNHARFSIFQQTNELKNFNSAEIVIDDNHKWFFVNKKQKCDPVVYAFDEVEGYNFENVGGKTVTKSKGGISRAVVGGLVAGPVGAVVGAGTSKHETETVGGILCLNIAVRTLSGKQIVKVYKPPRGLDAFLNQCMAGKQEKAKEEVSNDRKQPILSSADELLKWKELLEQGIITQEEFDVKKKQLLGI